MRLFRCLSVCAVALAHAGCFSPTGSVFTTQTTTTGDLTATSEPGATTITSDTPTTGTTQPDATTTTGVVATTSASSDPTTGTATGDPTTTTDATTTVAPSRCGDSKIEGDEQCDDGPLNGDANLCTSACQLAVCGDGLTCTTCSEPEECDDGNLTDTDDCTNQCLLAVRYVFVTADQYQYSFGGLAGADALCNMAAIANFNPKREFVAWLSDSETTAKGRILGGADLPYRTRKGDHVADNIGDLLDGSLQHAIDHDEHGFQVPGDGRCTANSSAWTATAPSGDGAGEHCGDWLQLNGTARVGNVTSVNARWTQDCTLPCDKSTYMRLYCIEKGG